MRPAVKAVIVIAVCLVVAGMVVLMLRKFGSRPDNEPVLVAVAPASVGGATSASNPVAPAPAALNTCDKKACGGVIQSYLDKNWAYTSSDFGECKDCPVVKYPNNLPS